MAFTIAPGRPAESAPNLQKEAANKARAVAILTGQKPPESTDTQHSGGSQTTQTPVQNPTKVAAEEMGAITIPAAREVPSTETPEPVKGQSSTSEAPNASEATTTAPKEVPLTSQFEALARKEKALRAKVLEVQSQESQYKAREEALAAREKAIETAIALEKRLETDPFAVLQEKGITYDKFAQHALSQPSAEETARNQEIAGLKAEIDALKKGSEDSKKSQEQAQQQAYQQAVKQLRVETDRLVKTLPDDYEMISKHKAEGDVVDLIEKTWKANGILLTVDEAAKQVEEFLLEETVAVSQSKKVQARLAANKAPEPQKPDATKQPAPVKTLSNAMGSTGKLSARERAIAVMEGRKVQ